MYKKIISLLLVIATLCSFLVVPASAEDILPPVDEDYGGFISGVVDFADWAIDESFYAIKLIGSVFSDEICPERVGSNTTHSFVVDTVSVDGALGDYYVCQYCGFNSGYTADAHGFNGVYNQYVSSLPFTGYNSDGSFLIPLTITGIDNNYPSDHAYANAMQWTASFSGNSYSASGVMYGSENTVYVRFAGISAPVAGFYTRITEFEGTNGAHEQQITLKPASRQHYTSGSSISKDGDYIYVYGTSRNNSCVVHGSAWLLCEPDAPLSGDMYSLNTRPASIVGDYGIIGDDGTIVKVDGNMIVDESTSTVFNPVTNVTNNYTDYAFDYSDRSYNLTLEDGSTIKVVYGNENITIQEGDIIYNVYYLIPDDSGSGGGSDSGDTPSGEDMSWWKQAWTSFTDKLFSILGNGGSSVNPDKLPSVPDDESTAEDDGWSFVELLVVLKDGTWNVITGVLTTAYDGFYGFVQAVSDSGGFFDYYDPENEQSIFVIPLEEGASVWD